MTVAALDRATTAETAVISGIASSPSVDSYGHSVRPGAFDASIRTRGLTGPSGVKLLAGHAGFPVGKILELRTIGSDLRISAELNLELQSARDLHSIVKHSGPLNFSVGFRLEDFDVDEKAKPGAPWLIIKRGDLHEVSIVSFPACDAAQMDMKARPLWLAKALAELQRTQALLNPQPVDVVAELRSRQAAIMSKVVEIRRALRKRDRDEETLRQWRHEYVDSPRGKMNI
jgi:HK97 family phage prohead protease